MSDLLPVRYRVAADASPGLLVRLLQPLARRDLTPDHVVARREDDLMHTEITFDAMPAEMVHLVAGNLGQVIGVQRVDTDILAGLRAAA